MAKIQLLFIFIIFGSLSAHTDSLSTVLEENTVKEKLIASEHDHPSNEYHFFQSLGNNFYEQAISPFSIKGDGFLLLGAGAVITGTLILIDPELDNIFSPLDNKNKLIRRTSPQLTEFGGTYGILSVTAFGAYSLLWNDKKAQQTTLLLTEAIITSGVWTRIGKIVFSRERPAAASKFSHERGGEWRWFTGFFSQRFQSVGEYDAFPSGHTATAFAIAAVIEDSYGDTFLITPIIYTLASAVGVTRMIEHDHWASDVFVGGVLGYLCGKQVVHHYRQYNNQQALETNISIGMIGNGPSLVLSVKF